jgi:hypothetical protein
MKAGSKVEILIARFLQIAQLLSRTKHFMRISFKLTLRRLVWWNSLNWFWIGMLWASIPPLTAALGKHPTTDCCSGQAFHHWLLLWASIPPLTAGPAFHHWLQVLLWYCSVQGQCESCDLNFAIINCLLKTDFLVSCKELFYRVLSPSSGSNETS